MIKTDGGYTSNYIPGSIPLVREIDPLIAKDTETLERTCGSGGGIRGGPSYRYDADCNQIWSDGRVVLYEEWKQIAHVPVSLTVAEVAEMDIQDIPIETFDIQRIGRHEITIFESIIGVPDIKPVGVPTAANIPQSDLPPEEQTIRTFEAALVPLSPKWWSKAVSNTVGFVGEGVGNILGFVGEKILNPALSGLATGLLGENWKSKLLIGGIILIVVIIIIVILVYYFKSYVGAKAIKRATE